MSDQISLTLAAGGSELPALVAQLAHPAADVAFVASATFAGANVGRSIVVEADVGSRTPGCSCCQMRVDLVDGIARAVRRRRPPRRVVVALDGHDDAITAIHTILSDPLLARLVRIDAVLATVDAVHWATRLATGGPIDTDVGLDRLAVADRVLVARSRHVTPDALGAIGHVLRSLNQVGPIIAPAIAGYALDELVDIHAWHGAPAIGQPPGEPSPFLGDDAPVTVVCRTDRALNADRVDEWLDEIIAGHAARLLRLQGAIAVPGQTERTCVHGVRSWAMSHSEAEHPAGRRSTTSTVVLIGRGLPVASLHADFAAAHR
ncbi:MAG: GTP-binding protein [Ilumatobacteraceae bacterium]